jgi:hypothetical protein
MFQDQQTIRSLFQTLKFKLELNKILVQFTRVPACQQFSVAVAAVVVVAVVVVVI